MNKIGYVCPDELKTHWSPEHCMTVDTVDGLVAIVCNLVQSTIFVGTEEEVCNFKRENCFPMPSSEYWPELSFD